MESDKKREILLAYAQSFPINDLPGFTNVMSIDSKYIRVSDNALPLIGYKTHDQLLTLRKGCINYLNRCMVWS
jgi:hypothetical protein